MGSREAPGGLLTGRSSSDFEIHKRPRVTDVSTRTYTESRNQLVRRRSDVLSIVCICVPVRDVESICGTSAKHRHCSKEARGSPANTGPSR
eukprot:5337350-Pyramimonas_sp.AAC.1